MACVWESSVVFCYLFENYSFHGNSICCENWHEPSIEASRIRIRKRTGFRLPTEALRNHINGFVLYSWSLCGENFNYVQIDQIFRSHSANSWSMPEAQNVEWKQNLIWLKRKPNQKRTICNLIQFEFCLGMRWNGRVRQGCSNIDKRYRYCNFPELPANAKTPISFVRVSRLSGTLFCIIYRNCVYRRTRAMLVCSNILDVYCELNMDAEFSHHFFASGLPNIL